MRIANFIALSLCMILVFSVARGASSIKLSRKVTWNVEPFSPCNSTMTDICNQQGNLCCQFIPPENECNNQQNQQEPLQQCYNSDQYTCGQDNAIPGASCLCPQGYECCYGACYIPGTSTGGFNCAVNQYPSNPQRKFQLCPKLDRACNGACYSPDSGYSCCQGPNGGILTFGACL
jgi:hypothetical protein